MPSKMGSESQDDVDECVLFTDKASFLLLCAGIHNVLTNFFIFVQASGINTFREV